MKWRINSLWVFLSCIALYGCVKVDEKPASHFDIKEGKWVQITNLEVDPYLYGVPIFPDYHVFCEDSFYFNMETGKRVPEEDIHISGSWDFALQLYGGRLFVINTKDSYYGKECNWGGSEGEPMLCTLIAKNFEDVTEAPDPEKYPYNRDLQENGEFVPGYNKDEVVTSWGIQKVPVSYEFKVGVGYCYTLSQVKEKGYEYANGDNAAKIIKDRTFILRTTKGYWAKLQIQGIYKDSPVEPDENSEPCFLTFRYYVQKDGSRNLDTR